MTREMHAEWTKLRTLPATPWLLLTVVALTVATTAMAATAATAAACPSAGCDYDTTELSLLGVQLGQAVVAVLAVLAIANEYGTGMIRITLTAMPRRATVLAAKTAVLTGLTLIAGTIAVLASVLAGRLILPGNGFTPAHGYPALSLADGPTLRAVGGSVLYLVLITVLSLGIAAAVRDSAAAVGAALGLLYLFPIIVVMIRDPDWQRRLWQISPANAGLAIQATTDLADLPLSPWAGLGVLAAWAAAALLTGAVILHFRDA